MEIVLRAGTLALCTLVCCLGCSGLPTDPTPSSAQELVVDVHAHAFSALHLPVSGFVSGHSGGDRRLGELVERLVFLLAPQDCEVPPVGGPDDVPDGSACMTWLELAASASPLRLGTEPRLSDAGRQALGPDAVQRVVRCQAQVAARALSTARRELAGNVSAELDALLNYALGRTEQRPLQPALFAEDDDAPALLSLDPRQLRARFDRTVQLVWVLTRSSDTIADCLAEAIPAADLTLALMLDMEVWFPDDAAVCRPLETQIADLRRAMTDPEHLGRLHGFLPFDPRRQVQRDGEALALVAANLEQGFLGVKLYPPVGFRAWGNDRRVLGEGDDPPGADAYDAALEQLYSYCVDNDVPITAHCNPVGAESSPGRGNRSNPRYWRDVLRRHPSLRLNLGHFGGHDLGVVGGWTETIGELMATYPHVYADLSYTDRQWDAAEVQRWRSFLSAWPEARQRLLFGSDWAMILQEPRGHAALADTRALFEQHFPDLLPGLLGQNALRFLALNEPRSQNRLRLEAFYDRVDPGFRPERWWPFVQVSSAD